MPTPASAALGAALLLASAPVSAQSAWQTLEAPSLPEWSLLGAALDLSGPHLFVGAPQACAPALGGPILTERGSVAVYERAPTGWSVATLLQSSTGHADDLFGISVAVEGDLAFVGASGDDAARDRAGAVYVYRRIQGVWTEVQRLTASDAVAGDGFGGAVAYSAGRLLVGAPLEGHGHYAEWGEAYIFELQGGLFVETAKFRPASAVRGDWFGYRVDLRGDRAAISSYSDGANGIGAGAVWLFEFDGQTWREVQRLLPHDGHAWGHFGVDVRLGDDEVVVGSHRAWHAGGVRGAVYVFRPGPLGWEETQCIRPVGLPNLAAFGGSVAYTERDTLLVGAPGADVGRGRVYELERTGAGVFAVARVLAPAGLAPYDYHGLQVRGDGGTIVASIAHHTVNHPSGGARRVGGASSATVGATEWTRPFCEAPLQASGQRAGLTLVGAAIAGQAVAFGISDLPAGRVGVLVANLPGSSAPAALGSCLVGPTAVLGAFVTDAEGAAQPLIPAQRFGAWSTPGLTLHLEARARAATSTSGTVPLAEPVRTHGLALRLRP